MGEEFAAGGVGGRRPMRAALSYDYIVGTALGLIDRDGPESLSMRKLGGELGVDPMAVYYHVPNKAALFDGIVRALYAEVDAQALDWDGGATDLVADFARRLRAALRRHSKAAPIVATRPVYVPSQLALGDRAIGRLREEGFTPRRALTLISCVQDFTVGQVLAEVAAPVGGPTVEADDAAAAMSPEDLPNLAAAVAGGYDADEQFELGLSALIDGFTRRARSTPSTTGSRPPDPASPEPGAPQPPHEPWR